MNAPSKTDAWWCAHCWDRHELPSGGDRRKRKPCPDCGEKLHRVSRYEWFLEEALFAAFDAAGADYSIRPQFPVEDHRGFTMPVRTSRDKQSSRDKQPGPRANSDTCFCLSHLYIGDKDRQVVHIQPPQSANRGQVSA